MMNETLLPCPHCGNRNPSFYDSLGACEVQCGGCPAYTRGEDESDARATWNRRTPDIKDKQIGKITPVSNPRCGFGVSLDSWKCRCDCGARVMIHEDRLREELKLGTESKLSCLDCCPEPRVTKDTEVGTAIIYRDPLGNGDLRTKTRSEPWELGDGTLVVSIEGRTGGYAANRLFIESKEHD